MRTQGTREPTATPSRGHGLDPLERAVMAIVGGRIRIGRLEVEQPDGRVRVFAGRRDGPRARLRIHDGRFLRRLVTTGAIALADSYVLDEYDTDDLASFIELMALHVEPEHRVHVPGWLDGFGRAAWRTLGRGAAPRGPLQDIVEHYDLGNDFYAAWLDPTMTYSSAYFARDEMSLEEAQREKYRRLAEATGVRAGERVLEVGSGWGGFAAYLAGELAAARHHPHGLARAGDLRGEADGPARSHRAGRGPRGGLLRGRGALRQGGVGRDDRIDPRIPLERVSTGPAGSAGSAAGRSGCR